MNSYHLLQLAIYEILDLLPCILLAVIPFRTQLRSVGVFFSVSALLYLFGIFRRILSITHPELTGFFSLVWIILYLLAYKTVIRASVSKILFILMTLLNYTNLVAVLYNYIGSRLFHSQLMDFPYCLEASLTALAIILLTSPFLYLFLKYKAAPLLCAGGNEAVWNYLWLVPATFCLIYYYNLYMAASILSFSRHAHNLLISVVTSSGAFFVLFLLLRLVHENNTILNLQKENHYLSIQNLQYQYLTGRMEETRRARHDLRQCLTIIQAFLQNDNPKELREFASRFCDLLTLGQEFIYCRHFAVNALISYYANLAAQKQISFQAQVDYPDTVPISDTDIVVLLGNLLENALEACCRRRQPPSFILLTIRQEIHMLIILIDNSCEPEYTQQNKDGFISSKLHGGIGLTSIRRIAEKNAGVLKLQCTGEEFHASVMLSIGEKECPKL